MLVAVAVTVLAGACRGSGSESADPSSTTVPLASDTSPSTTGATTTLVTLPPKPRTTTTVSSALGPGAARLTGTVNAPEGPVPGATVRVERLFGDAIAATTVMTDAAGQWVVDGVNGGRYRLRAWRPPDLAALEPTLLFLGATEKKNVTMPVARYGNDSALVTTTPNPPVRDQPATLVVTVSNGVVDGEGILHASPRPGVPIQLVPGTGLALESPDVVVTDAAGNAGFAVRCTQPGAVPGAAAVIGGTSRTLALPACSGR